MISVERALQLIETSVAALDVVRVSIAEAVGRVVAQDVVSDVDSPPHDKSVMDGYAVIANDVHDGVKLRVVETIVAGDWPRQGIQRGTCAKIMTGAPIPVGADSVVMLESTESLEDDGGSWIRVNSQEPISAGRHMLKRAASLAAGETVFHVGHRIRATDIGLLAEVGASHVDVYRQPSVAVLSTGNELVAAHDIPRRGQIRNSNGPMLAALCRKMGFPVTDLGIVHDHPGELRSKIEMGLEREILLLSGGVSAGILDLVPKTLADLSVQNVFHGVAVKPGKPIWFGVLKKEGKRTLVFGLPGNPVSSLVCFTLFVRAAMARMAGLDPQPHYSWATLAKPHDVRGNRPTYWPGRTVTGLEKWLVEPIEWQGSSDMRALGVADVLIFLNTPPASHAAGEAVPVLRLD
jgi:molybdopterin molybdotransferase